MTRSLGGAITFQQNPIFLPPSFAAWLNPPKKQGNSFAKASEGIP
jgi:hypothetical protein